MLLFALFRYYRMHAKAKPPATSFRRVLLAAFSEADLPALEPARKLLAHFKIIWGQTIFGLEPGQIPDFSELAESVAEGEVQVIIVAAREIRALRALATALTALVIRVPVPVDGSPIAGIAALAMEDNSRQTALDGPGNGSYATMAIGEAGVKNAVLLAVSILALTDKRLLADWQLYREEQTRAVLLGPPPGA